MRRTFDDFLTQVNLALGNRQDITQTHRGQLVNDALNKVANMYEHRTLQDIVQVQIAQSSDFGLLSDTVNFSWIDNVKDLQTGRPVYPGDRDKMEGVVKRLGSPGRFYTWGLQIFIDTLADVPHTLKIWYVKIPDEWKSGPSVLEEVYDPLIGLWAQRLGMLAVRDYDEANALGKEIGMYTSGHRFPTREQKYNDHGTSIVVRQR